MTQIVSAKRAILAGEEVRDFSFALDGGIITSIDTLPALRATAPQAKLRTYGQDEIVIPGCINGHSHAYQILLRGWADDLPFAQWRSDALYKIVPELTAEDIYWTFLAAFSEMLAAGITTVVEFFYLNGFGNERAQAAIEAARTSGIRLVFARTWMDAPYAPRAFSETIETAQARTSELLAKNPDITFCIAPHSLHAASLPMIERSAAYAREHDLLVHIHAAEAAYEGEQTLERHGATPIDLLDRIGVLDERLVLIHAIYLSEAEKDLVATRGARIVHNPMTNQYLGDGTCDVSGFLARGVRIALGTDADVKPSIFDEMRSAVLLQKLRATDGARMTAASAFDLGTAQGARALGLQTGALQEGFAADYCVLDAHEIDPWSPALNAIVYRAESSWVKQVIVGGVEVWSGAQSENATQARRHTRAIARRLNIERNPE